MEKQTEYFAISKITIRKFIEKQLHPDIIYKYILSDLIDDGDNYILKFSKRIQELTIEEYKELYE